MKIIITENQLNYLIENNNPDIKTSIKYLKNIPKEYKEFAIEHLNSYTKAKNGKITGLSLPEDFNTKLKNEKLPNGFDIGVDKNGFFIHTHRGRSKSKTDYLKIPKKDIIFIDSTG